LNRVLLSCAGAVAVIIIVVLLLSRTLRSESGAKPQSGEAVLSVGVGAGSFVDAFKTQKALEAYLIANASRDDKAVKRDQESSECVRLENGTHAVLLGYAGAGQGRVRITSGPHAGEQLYVSFLTVQQPGASR
jgi:hypothetical protein